MKRSEINHAINYAQDLLKKNNIGLPFFAYVKKEEWKNLNLDISVLKNVMLGWDVTDFGSGDFKKVGATLFTLRNGSVFDKSIGVPYCEKIIIMDNSGQEIPMHYHINKTEDIINRAGGTLKIQVYNSKSDSSLDNESKVILYCDGIKREFEPGAVIEVKKGNSVTLPPYVYHRFFADNEDVIVGEVSKINDDNTDNVFLVKSKYFINIEEDEAPEYCLVKEY